MSVVFSPKSHGCFCIFFDIKNIYYISGITEKEKRKVFTYLVSRTYESDHVIEKKKLLYERKAIIGLQVAFS